MASWPLRRLSIRLTAPLVLTLPVVAVAGVLIWLSWRQGHDSAATLARDRLTEIHARVNQRVTSLLSTPRRVNLLNKALLEEGRLDPDNLRSWRPFLFEQVRAFDMLSGVMWGDKDGNVAWMFRYPGKRGYEFGIRDEQTGEDVLEYTVATEGTEAGTMPAEPAGRYPYDPRKRPWYRDAVEAGRPTWVEYVWVNEDGGEVTWGLALAEPLKDEDGQLLGVLDSELSLFDISAYLETVEVGRSGTAFLLDRTGLVVANSRGEPVHDDKLNRMPGSRFADPLIGTASRRLNDDFQSLAFVDGEHHDVIAIDGQPALMVVSPIEPQAGLTWLLVTVAPMSDFLDEVYAGLWQSLLIGLAAAAAVLLVGVAVAIAGVQPIIKLVNHARQLGAGKLDSKLDLDYSPEFRLLSSEINRMAVDLQDRLRMRHSLAVAMEVQRSLLPEDTPTIEGLDLAGHSTYCDETGGDYYDFLEVAGLGDGTAAVAVGDVVGHGVAAALLMASARGILRSRCREPGTLGQLLSHLNDMLVIDTGGERFMTMLLMAVDTERRSIRWASAGHDPPIVYQPSSGQFLELDGGGLALGILHGQTYDEYRLDEAEPHQILFAGTDGVWESANAGGEMFGKDRVRQILRDSAHLSAEEIGNRLRSELRQFCGHLPAADDVTFVVAKIE